MPMKTYFYVYVSQWRISRPPPLGPQEPLGKVFLLELAALR